MKTWMVAVGIIIAVFAMAAVACSDNDDDETPVEQEVAANAQLCADLTSLGAALDAYGSLDLESTKAELDDVTQVVSDALEAVNSSAEALGDVRTSNLEDAVNSLRDAAGDIPDDATIAEGLDSISDEAAVVNAAIISLFSEAGC